MRATARKSGPSRRAQSLPPLLCGSGFRVAPSRDLDLKQRRQLGRRRRHSVRTGYLDVDQLLERATAPDLGQNPAPGPLPGPNLVPPPAYHVVHEERPPKDQQRHEGAPPLGGSRKRSRNTTNRWWCSFGAAGFSAGLSGASRRRSMRRSLPPASGPGTKPASGRRPRCSGFVGATRSGQTGLPTLRPASCATSAPA